MDWWGNVTFAAGLIAVLVGITHGIQPHGTSQTELRDRALPDGGGVAAVR